MHALLTRLGHHLRKFAGARDGNVAVVFAIAILPIVGFAGAAVDYSHAGSVRSAMQSALDSAALMLSKDAATLTTAELKDKGTKYFNALFNHDEATVVDIAPVYTSSGGSSLTMTGTVKVKTDFMGVIGIKELTLGSSSTVKWGNARLRVALALDVTGSMASDGKMTALKPAAKGLLTQLKSAASVDGDVYVSIVPFAKDVNVGAANHNQTWVDFTGWDNENGSCSKDDYSSKSSCTNAGKTWTAKAHSTWTGCVMDRDQDYDVKNTTPATANTSTLFPAEQYDNCPAAMIPLSYNWTALNAKIDELSPQGSTNQPIGLAWAWQSLSSGVPLNAPAMDTNYTYQQVIILMSDGLNTQDRWYGNGSSVSASVDSRMNKVCANAKAAGITIYAIHVNTDGDPTSTVLQNCASDSSKFFVLTSATALTATFQQIGSNLSQLRIAQ
jgi:Flp pilus assembly protein TadG